MPVPGRIKKYLPLFTGLLLFSISVTLVGAFLSRSPVLIVTDSSFFQLYGPQRLKQKERRAALKLFRQFIPVTVSESAGADLIAIAVEDAFPSPWAVLFPSRYLEGARLYKESKPEIPVLVLGRSDTMEAKETPITLVFTDAKVDLYRAALCAAQLAGEKKILIFDDGLFLHEDRESLKEELKKRGFPEEPVFQSPSINYNSYPEIGCVVVTGPVSGFVDKNLDIPLILFSWTDPALTPRTVKLIFDDSPWALAPIALKFFLPAPTGPEPETLRMGEILVPSEPVILQGRLDQKRDFWKLRRQLKEKFQKN
jgi:hypothetical protein